MSRLPESVAKQFETGWSVLTGLLNDDLAVVTKGDVARIFGCDTHSAKKQLGHHLQSYVDTYIPWSYRAEDGKGLEQSQFKAITRPVLYADVLRDEPIFSGSMHDFRNCNHKALSDRLRARIPTHGEIRQTKLYFLKWVGKDSWRPSWLVNTEDRDPWAWNRESGALPPSADYDERSPDAFHHSVLTSFYDRKLGRDELEFIFTQPEFILSPHAYLYLVQPRLASFMKGGVVRSFLALRLPLGLSKFLAHGVLLDQERGFWESTAVIFGGALSAEHLGEMPWFHHYDLHDAKYVAHPWGCIGSSKGAGDPTTLRKAEVEVW